MGEVRFMKVSVADRPADVVGGYMSRVCRFRKKWEGFVGESFMCNVVNEIGEPRSEQPSASISHSSVQRVILSLNWRC